MLSAKFLGANGGTVANAIKAVDYFTNLKIKKGINLVATNNSWGGGGFSQGLLDAITRGAKQGILFIAAAGNGNMVGIGQNNDKKANYPSNYNTLGQTGGEGLKCDYDAVVAVAAIDKNGRLASFSNFGANTVDIAAPGVGIWSSIPSNVWAAYDGTSMATPHVTGAVALYAARHYPLSTNKDQAATIKNAIIRGARPTSSVKSKCVSNGRLDAFRAITGDFSALSYD
jgi:subtilisin family serine protease